MLEPFAPLEVAKHDVFLFVSNRGDYHVGFAAANGLLKRALRIGMCFFSSPADFVMDSQDDSLD